MSQIYKNLAAGPVPPSVAQSYVTDVNSPAIPAANVLDVFGGSVTTNNNHGIQTDGSSGSNVLTVQLTNRISVTATTSDGGGQTQTVTLITPTNATAVEFSASIIGYDATNDNAAGGSQEGIARKSGGTAVIIGTNDSLDESDASLAAVDWNIISSGGDLAVQFVGIAGKTIAWRCLFTYTQTP